MRVSAQSVAALGSLLEEDEDGNVPGIRRASDQLKANRREVAAPVISLLEQIVENRSTELSQICRLVRDIFLLGIFLEQSSKWGAVQGQVLRGGGGGAGGDGVGCGNEERTCTLWRGERSGAGREACAAPAGANALGSNTMLRSLHVQGQCGGDRLQPAGAGGDAGRH